MTKSEKERNAALNGGRGSGQSVRILADAFEAKIADIKANCDLAIEGRDVKIKELEEDVRNKNIAIKNRNAEIKQLGERCNQLLKDKGDLTDKCKELEQQIEKMKCCGNCRFGYCERSSERIDKDGNRTFHCWNEEKEKYCDVGKNGKYQCWELEEND